MITKRNRAEYFKKYFASEKNKAKNRLSAKKWRRNHPSYKNNWISSNQDLVKSYNKEYQKVYYRNARIICLNYYSKNNPQCNCCGEQHVEFLCLDHVNNGGNKHRKGKGNICRWIIKNNFPKIFQILCHNCNMAKGFYGKCPHAVLKPVQN